MDNRQDRYSSAYNDNVGSDDSQLPQQYNSNPVIRVGITQGDINGIGLEVIVKALGEPEILDSFIPIVYGSPKAMGFYRKNIEVSSFNLNIVRGAEEAHARIINVVSCGDDNVHVEPGISTQAGGLAAYESLKAAVTDLKSGKIDILVTAPINNKNIQGDNFRFPGQTEFLQSEVGNGAKSLMLNIAGNVRVGIVAGHMPIAQVPNYITKDRILEKLRIFNASLQKDFTIRRPRIAVLGLNPHAGDCGLLGSEEEEVIIPAIEQASEEGIFAMGPYSADAIFGSDVLNKFDGVLAMYHDQGVAPFKSLALECGVSYTAGLPFVRTAPGHGTAYDIAGQGKATPDSMRAAIWLAIDVYKNRRQNAEISASPMVLRAETVRERNA